MDLRGLSRRDFLKLSLSGSALMALEGLGLGLVNKAFGSRDTGTKVLILGLDGIDPHLLGVLMLHQRFQQPQQ